MLLIRLFFLQLLFCAPFAWASDGAGGGQAELIVQASEKRLARHPYWMKLLHYRSSVLPSGASVSDIVSPNFFLAADGSHEAEHELAATLKAFFLQPGATPDDHAQCRFVARYQWLRKMLDWQGAPPPQVACRQFAAWSRHGRLTSLSMVFATGYFSNPASYNGHLLLKFNTDDTSATSGLLDESLNFGAIVPDNEIALVYVTKGILGGYESAFSNTQFYRQNHDYAENELRDMWEYELSLSKDEVEQIAAHSWELMRVRFTYFFAKENCAYRMAELLGLVVEQPLLNTALPWSMPSAVFDHLVRIERNGQPLVRVQRLIPSRLSRFHAEYDALGEEQKSFVLDWAKRRRDFSGPDYAGLPDVQKIAVIHALLDYAEFRTVKDKDKDDDFGPAARRQLLIERSRFPIQHEDLPVIDIRPPHEGPLPVLVRIGPVHNDVLGHGIALRMHPTYFDTLSLDAGRIPHATLTMFDLDAAYFQGKFRLTSLDLVNIENFNVSHTPLPGDGGWAWRVGFGLGSHDLSCFGCTIPRVTGGAGRAMQLSKDVLAYAMAGLQLQESYRHSGTVAANGRIGCVVSLGKSWKSNLELERRSFLDDTRGGGWFYKWESRFGDRRDWDVRFGYQKRVASEWQVAFSIYW